jgi:hypothetical protein
MIIPLMFAIIMIVSNTKYTKFLGLIIDDTLLWKYHIDQIMSKLNSNCFVFGSVKSVFSEEILRMIYSSYINSIITCGIIVGNNSPASFKIFRI